MKNYDEVAREKGIEVKKYEWKNKEHSQWKHKKNEKVSNIYCPFCGFCCKSLASHLVVHGLTKKQSKDLFGLRTNGRMTCLSTHAKYSNENLRRIALGIIGPKVKTKQDSLQGNVE